MKHNTNFHVFFMFFCWFSSLSFTLSLALTIDFPLLQSFPYTHNTLYILLFLFHIYSVFINKYPAFDPPIYSVTHSMLEATSLIFLTHLYKYYICSPTTPPLAFSLSSTSDLNSSQTENYIPPRTAKMCNSLFPINFPISPSYSLIQLCYIYFLCFYTFVYI